MGNNINMYDDYDPWLNIKKRLWFITKLVLYIIGGIVIILIIPVLLMLLGGYISSIQYPDGHHNFWPVFLPTLYIILVGNHVLTVIFNQQSDKSYSDEAVVKDAKSVHEPYTMQMKGRFCKNPILFILDYLHQRVLGCFPFYIIDLVLFMISLCLWVDVISEYKLDFLYPLLVIVFRIPSIYRWIRHLFFKKHKLPGPYGWGTLDYYPVRWALFESVEPVEHPLLDLIDKIKL